MNRLPGDGSRRPIERLTRRLTRKTSDVSAPPALAEQLADRLLDSSVFDVDYYRAASGAEGDDLEVALDFVHRGLRSGLPPHFLIEPEYLPGAVQARLRQGDVERLLSHFSSEESLRHPWSPLFDPRMLTHEATNGQALLAGLDPLTETPVPTGYHGRVPNLEEVRERLLDVVRNQRLAAERGKEYRYRFNTGASHPASAGLTSVVVSTSGEHRRTRQAIDRVFETTVDSSVEVVVVDDGVSSTSARVLIARFLVNESFEYLRVASPLGYAASVMRGAMQARGETLCLLHFDTEVRGRWLSSMLARLQAPGVTAVQAALTDRRGVIANAGYWFPAAGELPAEFLAGHPRADLERHGGSGIAAVSSAAMVIRAVDFDQLGGFSVESAPGLESVELALRSVDSGFTCEVEPAAVVIHDDDHSESEDHADDAVRAAFRKRWAGRIPPAEASPYRSLGFDLPHFAPVDRGRPRLRPVIVRGRRTTDLGGRSVPSLRWAIKLGADNSRSGDLWGDVPFADDLADALRQLGQEVVVDRFDARVRETSYLDDVELVLRGRRRIDPQPGRLNILWAISRPETISVDELVGFDLVYGASVPWSSRMSTATGRAVEPLLQAVNPQRFSAPEDGSVDEKARSGIVFVGGPRPQHGGRPVVRAALAAKIPLELWGPEWDRFAPEEMVRGQYADPHRLPEIYRSAEVVLNDHLGEMAEHGFMNNRLFDAIASGAAVVSDPVAGLELFDGAAAPAQDDDEVASLLRNRDWIPRPEQMAAIARRIRLEHSFAARARTLLDAALGVREW